MKKLLIHLLCFVGLAGCTMEVPDMPVANFEQKQEGQGLVTFTSKSQNATSYVWDFGDGKSQTILDDVIAHKYEQSGKYNVKLIARSESGSNGKTLEIEVKIDAPPIAPIADFSYTATNEQSAPCDVILTNKSTGNFTSRQWKLNGNLISSEKDAKYTFKDPGKFKVSLTVTGPGGSGSKEIEIEIKTKAASVLLARFSVSNSGDVASVTSTFTNTSENATGFIWNFGDGTLSSEVAPKHTYANPGIYNVILTATGQGGANQSSGQVIVLAPCRVTQMFTGNDIASSTITYQYNNADNLTVSTDRSNGSNEFVNTLSRNFNGDVINNETFTIIRKDVADVNGTVKHYYNNLGLLIKSEKNFTRTMSPYITGDRGTSIYEYDANQIISKITSDSTIYTYSNGVLTHISYIGNGTAQKIKVDGIVYSGSPGIIRNGRIETFAYTEGAIRQLTYDGKGRRISDIFTDSGRKKKITEYWTYDDHPSPSFAQSRLKGHPFYAETGFGNVQNNVTSYRRLVQNTTSTDAQDISYQIDYNDRNLPVAIRRKNDSGAERKEYKYSCR